MENKIVFMLLKPKESFKVNEVLRLIDEYSRKDEDHYTISDEITIGVVKQRAAYEKNVKWVNSLINTEFILDKLKRAYKLPSYQATLKSREVILSELLGYKTWKKTRCRRGGVFLFDEAKVSEHRIPEEYLYPLVPSSRYIKYFTFKDSDWDEIRSSGAECYLFFCNRPREQLPPDVQEYIRKGEGLTLSLGSGTVGP